MRRSADQPGPFQRPALVSGFIVALMGASTARRTDLPIRAETHHPSETVMIIYPVESIEPTNGKLGTVSLPSDPHGRVRSIRVKVNRQNPLTTYHQRMFPLVMLGLLAAFGLNLKARAQDVPKASGQVQSAGTNSKQKGNSMEAIGLLVTLEARPGKEADAEAFLKSAQPLASNEKGTLKWYAIKVGPGKFGIFDTFADEGGRNAHLTGEIAKALGARADELFAVPPQIEKVEVLANTPLKH